MKGKKVEKFGEKISLTGRKWFSLNAPSTETPLSHSRLWSTVGASFYLLFFRSALVVSGVCFDRGIAARIANK